MYIGFWAAGMIANSLVIKDVSGAIVNHNWNQIWLFLPFCGGGDCFIFNIF
jgi:hypothetical protein